LARVEINAMLNAIADLIPDIEMTGTPTRGRSGWINGIATMPVRFNSN
jgi:cholest-4-en-3-one 26-monooxygenase